MANFGSNAKADLDFLERGGEMGRRIRLHDWAETPFGALPDWPQSLCTALSICLLSSLPTVIYWGADLRLLYNDAWASNAAEKHPWALGQPAREVWADIWDVLAPQFAQVIGEHAGISTVDQMLPMLRQGQVCETYWSYSFTPVCGEQGSVVGLLSQGRETTARVLDERHRKAEATRQQKLFQQAPGFVMILNGPSHIFEFVNDAHMRLFGDRQAVGRSLRDVFPELEGQGFFEAIDKVYTTGERHVAQRAPAMLPSPGGAPEQLFLDFVLEPVLGEDGQVSGIFCEGFDVTAAHRSEEALVVQSRAFEILNRVGAALTGELDLERLIQTLTDAGVELTGAQFGAYFHNLMDETGERLALFTLSGADREDFARLGRPRPTGVLGPTFRNEVMRVSDILADPRYGRSEPHMGMPKGHLPVRSYLAVPVTSRSGPVLGGLLFGHPEPGRFDARHEALMISLAAQAAVAIDNARLFAEVQHANETLEARVLERTSELAQAHAALRQAQKMEAVGQLTGGIAHDFNNLLAGISGSLEIVERRLAQNRVEGLDRFINAAQTSARRATALTQRLLAFSRRQTLDPKPTDINRLVFGMEDLIRRTAGPAIKLEVVGAGGLWAARVDAAQLESALLNLAINARDSMPDGGRLTIETANMWLDQRGATERELAPGQYLSICVTDTGTGIPKDIIDRIFDPFFTTKPIGQGTGLGLSMIHGFVRQSGGQVRVYSEAGMGTTMCLYLPRHNGDLVDETNVVSARTADPGTGETVLVIDDEPTVRMLIVEVLNESGYRTLEAEDGPSGLKILFEVEHIDLLITDVGLPGGMNGRQVADAARHSRPDLKVLFVTGYAENAVVGNGYLEPGMEIVTKPFMMTELANRIAGMLQRKPVQQ